MRFAIARAVNGICINGDEYVLDDAGEVMTFPSVSEARKFLRANGISRPSLQGIRIIRMEDELR